MKLENPGILFCQITSFNTLNNQKTNISYKNLKYITFGKVQLKFMTVFFSD